MSAYGARRRPALPSRRLRLDAHPRAAEAAGHPADTLSELTGPVYGHKSVLPNDADLTRQHEGEPLGERIIVTGRISDEDGRPVANTLVEIWQADAAGRHVHVRDQHPAPLDPDFSGARRCVTDAEGFRFDIVLRGRHAMPFEEPRR